MKIIIRIIIWFFILVIVVYACLSVFFLRRGKSYLEERLASYCHRPVSVGRVTVVPPLGLRIDALTIPQIVTAKTVVAQFAMAKFFRQPLVLNSLQFYNASFPIIHTKEGRLFLEGLYLNRLAGPVGGEAGTGGVGGKGSLAATVKGVLIENFTAQNSQVIFVDYAPEQELKVELENIHLRAHNVSIPLRSLKTNFDLSASVFSESLPFSGSKVEAKGWANFKDLDMEAVFRLKDSKGGEGISAQAKSVKNDLTVQGKVNLGLLSSQMEKKDVNEFMFADFALGALQSSGLDVGLNFSFRTTMDNFKVDSIAINGEVNLKEGDKGGLPQTSGKAVTPGPEKKTFGVQFKESLVPVTK